MAEMRFDFDGLIQLLARHLYSEKRVFIRELIQNAHDAVKRRQKRDGDAYTGKISIETRPDDLQFIIRDTGIGMNKADLEEYLSTIGKGATRVVKQEENSDGLIGQFGIGFLSAFVVAARVEVRTRKLGEQEGWLWKNAGNKEYTIERCEVAQPGTTVIVYLKGVEEKGVIHEEEVRDTIRYYADMLTVPIHLNGSGGPINAIRMPWEQAGSSWQEVQFDTRIYLERTMRDSVLELIPIDLKEFDTTGALYITRWRTVQHQIPRTIRLFVNRMFICEKEADLLPPWAQFVNGIICCTDETLTLTAARDNFIRDDNLEKLQQALGDIIVQHMEKLSKKDPQRFSQILRYHDLSIKAACHYYDEFFDKFADLLEWRTNKGSPTAYAGDFTHEWRTLPQVLELLPKTKGKPQRVPYFTDSNATNQYFQMADAAKTLVVNASYGFEAVLIKAYAKRAKDTIQLIAVDREDDPNVFQKLNNGTDRKIRQLAEYMSQIIRPGGTGKIRVEASYFEPKDLSALIRTGEAGLGEMKAREILGDPQASEELREMAREMLTLSRNASMRLVLNAGNQIIRRLAKQDFTNPHVQEVMRGVYNSAILYNQELMTPQNARIFYEHFQNFMVRNLEYIGEKSDLERQASEVRKQREALEESKRGKDRAKHVIFFLMTPLSDEYKPYIETVREVIEDRFSCQLFVASDRQYQDTITDNVFAHMDQADAFIAEVTDANPNVMFELGAARYDLRGRPIILMLQNSQRPLPSDLQGRIYIDYGQRTGDELADHLDSELRADERIKPLLNRPSRERYVSPNFLKNVSRMRFLESKVWQTLSEQYPTQETWQKASVEAVRKALGENEDLASALLKRIKQGLSSRTS